jgi:hypothetical protein
VFGTPESCSGLFRESYFLTSYFIDPCLLLLPLANPEFVFLSIGGFRFCFSLKTFPSAGGYPEVTARKLPYGLNRWLYSPMFLLEERCRHW